MKKAFLLSILLITPATASAQTGFFSRSSLRSVPRGYCDTNSCAASVAAARCEADLDCGAIQAVIESQRAGANAQALNQFGRVQMLPSGPGSDLSPVIPRPRLDTAPPPPPASGLADPRPSMPGATPRATPPGTNLESLPQRTLSPSPDESLSPRSGRSTSESERIKAGSGNTAPGSGGQSTKPR